MPAVEVPVTQIPIRGSVAAGTTPIRGFLTFTSRGGDLGKTVSLTSDENGEFSGFLPREGLWDVRVLPQTRDAYVIKRGVEVKRRGDLPYARVDVVLPGGRIAGNVVDRTGKVWPEPSSVVLYRDGLAEATARVDSDGKFGFFGLAPGAVALRALARRGNSDMIASTVSEDSREPVQLVIGSQRVVRGTALSSDGFTIAGAIVRFSAATVSGTAEVITDPGGNFEINVPDSMSVVTVALLANGFPVTVSTVPVDDDTKVELIAGSAAGELSIPMTSSTPIPYVGTPGGTPLPIRALLFPPDGLGPPKGITKEGFSISIASGVYTLCKTVSDCRTIQIRTGERATFEVQPSGMH